MNIQVIKSAWRRWKKPSAKTLASLNIGAGTPSSRPTDFWPDYAPRRAVAAGVSPAGSHDAREWDTIARTLTAHIGKEVS